MTKRNRILSLVSLSSVCLIAGIFFLQPSKERSTRPLPHQAQLEKNIQHILATLPPQTPRDAVLIPSLLRANPGLIADLDGKDIGRRLRAVRSLAKKSDLALVSFFEKRLQQKELSDIERIAILGSLYRVNQDSSAKDRYKRAIDEKIKLSKSEPVRNYAKLEIKALTALNQVPSDRTSTSTLPAKARGPK